MSESLPDYSLRLDALHRALVDDFTAIVAQLPLGGGEQVLDAGCGSGFFTRLLAARLDAGGVQAVDSSSAFLDVARSRTSDLIAEGRVGIVRGDVRRLPFDAGRFDVVWSAHSMQSYDDIPAVLLEFRRVLKPGGLLAVLESDAMHSIMLPWPPRVELAVREAERQLIGGQDERCGAYFPRYAAKLLREARFQNISARHTFVYRPAPLDEPLRTYVRLYLDDLLKRTDARMGDESTHFLKTMAASYAKEKGPWESNEYFGSLQVLTTAIASG